MSIIRKEELRCNLFVQHNWSHFNKKESCGFKSIWVVVVWSLWIHRNNVVFRGEAADVHKVFDLAQVLSSRLLTAPK